MDGYTERAREYIRLTKRVEELTDPLHNVQAKELKESNQRMKQLEAELLVDFEDSGRQRDNLDGRTVYLQVDVYASCTNLALARDVFPDHGLGDLVKPSVNAQTLRSWLLTDLMKPLGLKRALGPDGKLVPQLAEKIPEGLQDCLKITQTPRIKVSAATTS